jgi:hypothetical protein
MISPRLAIEALGTGVKELEVLMPGAVKLVEEALRQGATEVKCAAGTMRMWPTSNGSLHVFAEAGERGPKTGFLADSLLKAKNGGSFPSLGIVDSGGAAVSLDRQLFRLRSEGLAVDASHQGVSAVETLSSGKIRSITMSSGQNGAITLTEKGQVPWSVRSNSQEFQGVRETSAQLTTQKGIFGLTADGFGSDASFKSGGLKVLMRSPRDVMSHADDVSAILKDPASKYNLFDWKNEKLNAAVRTNMGRWASEI